MHVCDDIRAMAWRPTNTCLLAFNFTPRDGLMLLVILLQGLNLSLVLLVIDMGTSDSFVLFAPRPMWVTSGTVH